MAPIPAGPTVESGVMIGATPDGSPRGADQTNAADVTTEQDGISQAGWAELFDAPPAEPDEEPGKPDPTAEGTVRRIPM
jgi:hypothetical protein